MAYPSAEAGLSRGLQAGIQTGLAMRKQQQDEKTAEFQKQKYEEQMNFQKDITMSANFLAIANNENLPEASRLNAINQMNKITSKYGYDAPEITQFDGNTKTYLKQKMAIVKMIQNNEITPEQGMKFSQDAKNQFLTTASPTQIAKADKATTDIDTSIKNQYGAELGKDISELSSLQSAPELKNPENASDLAALNSQLAGSKVDLQNEFGDKADDMLKLYGVNKTEDATTKTINSWAEAMYGKKWEQLAQNEKLAVMDRMAVQNPKDIRQSAPPIYNFVQTGEGIVPGNVRTGKMGEPTGFNKPMPNEMITQNQQIGTLKETLNRVKTLYKKDYVGPVAGRVAGLEESTVGLSTEQAIFNADNAQIQNTLVYLMSGKQINEQEYARLKKQLPDKNLPPSVYEARMDTFEKTLDSIIKEREKNQGGYGTKNKVEPGQTDLRKKYGY